ncbi:hypothetical protein HaLaN_12974 [Haematococcus lacustris]|uniref:Uncharacterized protein n=1 Tax=Haematococcus lacustris TaxID=44745 RepID=A0A699Z4P4_HAELA|nr:hypothetical protein HaLaN_12974 [Haematococcus lacustris]
MTWQSSVDTFCTGHQVKPPDHQVTATHNFGCVVGTVPRTTKRSIATPFTQHSMDPGRCIHREAGEARALNMWHEW